MDLSEKVCNGSTNLSGKVTNGTTHLYGKVTNGSTDLFLTEIVTALTVLIQFPKKHPKFTQKRLMFGNVQRI